MRNEIYTLVCGETFFWLSHVLFCCQHTEPLYAIVGADVSSYRACDGRPRGIGDTWKEAVTQLLVRKVLPAKHQKIGPSDSRSIQINIILAFPPYLSLGRSPWETSTDRTFIAHNFPFLYLLSRYLHYSLSTFLFASFCSYAMHMNSEWWVCLNQFRID
jgi:hypothetical protein